MVLNQKGTKRRGDISSASFPALPPVSGLKGVVVLEWTSNAASLSTITRDHSYVSPLKQLTFVFSIVYIDRVVFISPGCVCQLMKCLGVGESWRFVDVVGLESEQLAAVPKPCCALMLLFPLTQQVITIRAAVATTSCKGGVSHRYRLSGVG